VKVLNFKCPAGFKWDCEAPEPAEIVTDYKKPFLDIFDKVMESGPSEWLASMASQCKSMYENPPSGMTCKDRSAFKNRYYAKLMYYIKSEKEKSK
jgi:hypothetical protein